MQNNESKSLPRVRASADILLSDAEISLLRKAFHDYSEIFLEKEFGGGFGGARVFRLLPVRVHEVRDARLVTKIGPADNLRHEFENYEKCAGRALPFTAAQVGEPCEQDGQAVLNYAFVGDADLGKSLSLEEYYHTHTAAEVIWTLENLLGKALGPIWYGQSLPLTCLFRDEYGRHLPPHHELEEIVRKIFPKVVSADGSQVTVPGVAETFPNPLTIYPSLLDKILKGRRSFVHGDLHLRNVLVDERGKGWLIDFAKVQERHNLFDFIKLEVYIRLMALAKEYGAFSLSEYVQFEQSLHTAALGQNAKTPSNSKLKFGYQVILAIRELAGNYQADRNGFREEYLPALLLYALAMMKYHSSNGDVPTQLIFVTTCVCARGLLEEKAMSKKAVNAGQQEKSDPEKPGGPTKVDTGGGAYIGGNVKVGGNLIGRDQVTNISVGDISNSTGVAIGPGSQVNVRQNSGVTPDEIAQAFGKIMQVANTIPEEQERQEAAEAVEKLETEARLGEQANEGRVERWLHFLAEISEDVWEVAVNTFINPIKGLGTVFQKVARKARQEKKKEG